jgi:hypothetical protein
MHTNKPKFNFYLSAHNYYFTKIIVVVFVFSSLLNEYNISHLFDYYFLVQIFKLQIYENEKQLEK